MKKRMLALLLALCCTGGSMTAALAVDTVEEASDPNKVVAFSEDDDPLAHTNREEDLHETVFDGTMATEYAASTYSYVSPFNSKSYRVPDGYNIYNGIDVAKYQGDINWNKVKMPALILLSSVSAIAATVQAVVLQKIRTMPLT